MMQCGFSDAWSKGARARAVATFFAIFTLLQLTGVGFATGRDIAITIDDLPLQSESEEPFNKIVTTLIRHKAPAIGFVIANRLNPKQRQVLAAFKNKGFSVGSHSWSHPNLRRVGVDQYINDIALADKALAPLMTTPKYFRYPYLAQGRWWWTRHAVHAYLEKNHYLIAPVTIDSKDWEFNLELSKMDLLDEASLARLNKRYLAYIWRQTLKAEGKTNRGKQILLIHANLLNSYFLESVLQMYQRHGYRFIALDEALL